MGQSWRPGASLSSTPILVGAALFVIYLILGILYESLVHPITIISTLQSAGLGALLLLMAAGFDLSLIAIVGIILLIGVVRKSGMMLVDFAQQVKHTEGLSAEDAIYKACILRFRPIGATRRRANDGRHRGRVGDPPARHRRGPRPLAILTLYTTPVVYIYFDKYSSWVAAYHSRPKKHPDAVVPTE
jgi:AcrB/AcrD/AcrF family